LYDEQRFKDHRPCYWPRHRSAVHSGRPGAFHRSVYSRSSRASGRDDAKITSSILVLPSLIQTCKTLVAPTESAADSSQAKQLFGFFDLVAAALLFRTSTRKAGLRMAAVGFAGGLYGQWYTDGEIGQVGAFFALACLGVVLLG
jgi:hypothetical protein